MIHVLLFLLRIISSILFGIPIASLSMGLAIMFWNVKFLELGLEILLYIWGIE